MYILLLIILLISIISIIGYMMYIRNKNNEHMNNILNNIEINNLPKGFFLKNNRHFENNVDDSNKKCNTVNGGECNCGDSCKCVNCPCTKITGEFGKHCKLNNVDDNINWNIDYVPGANNNYQDLILHQISPRKLLINNCTDCSKYVGKQYNTPQGNTTNVLPENYNSSFMLNDEIYPENNNYLLSSTFSSKKTNGIPALKESCVQNKIKESHSCMF